MKTKILDKHAIHPIPYSWEDVKFPCLITSGFGCYAIATGPSTGFQMSTLGLQNSMDPGTGTWEGTNWYPCPESILLSIQN